MRNEPEKERPTVGPPIYKPSPAPVSTPSGYDMFGSKPKPAVSASVLRKVSKSKFSRMSGFSRALKSRLKVEGYSEISRQSLVKRGSPWESNVHQGY